MTSSIATLILTFTQQSDITQVARLAILIGGLGVLYLFARSRLIRRLLKRLIVRILDRWTSVRVYDYEKLLGLSKGYTICSLKVREDSWISNRKLEELNLKNEGVLVLAVYRSVNGDERYMGVPDGSTEIKPGDNLICYARESVSMELSNRVKGTTGDQKHAQQIQEEEKRSRIRNMQGGYE